MLTLNAVHFLFFFLPFCQILICLAFKPIPLTASAQQMDYLFVISLAHARTRTYVHTRTHDYMQTSCCLLNCHQCEVYAELCHSVVARMTDT